MDRSQALVADIPDVHKVAARHNQAVAHILAAAAQVAHHRPVGAHSLAAARVPLAAAHDLAAVPDLAAARTLAVANPDLAVARDPAAAHNQAAAPAHATLAAAPALVAAHNQAAAHSLAAAHSQAAARGLAAHSLADVPCHPAGRSREEARSLAAHGQTAALRNLAVARHGDRAAARLDSQGADRHNPEVDRSPDAERRSVAVEDRLDSPRGPVPRAQAVHHSQVAARHWLAAGCSHGMKRGEAHALVAASPGAARQAEAAPGSVMADGPKHQPLAARPVAEARGQLGHGAASQLPPHVGEPRHRGLRAFRPAHCVHRAPCGCCGLAADYGCVPAARGCGCVREAAGGPPWARRAGTQRRDALVAAGSPRRAQSQGQTLGSAEGQRRARRLDKGS